MHFTNRFEFGRTVEIDTCCLDLKLIIDPEVFLAISSFIYTNALSYSARSLAVRTSKTPTSQTVTFYFPFL